METITTLALRPIHRQCLLILNPLRPAQMLDVLATTNYLLNHRTDTYLPCPAHHPILPYNVEFLHLRTKTTFAGTTKTMASAQANACRNVHFSLLGILTSYLYLGL